MTFLRPFFYLQVHIRGADIKNGDDSICMKSPAQDVLVESSTVRQGNGFVVGTSDDADFRNITFRNCTAIGTAFGIHIKFKDQQTGSVRDITFEDINIVDPQRHRHRSERPGPVGGRRGAGLSRPPACRLGTSLAAEMEMQAWYRLSGRT